MTTWLPKDTIFLEPKDWFTRGHTIIVGKTDYLEYWHLIINIGIYVWSSPPAAADMCLEELRNTRTKGKSLYPYYRCRQIVYTVMAKEAK